VDDAVTFLLYRVGRGQWQHHQLSVVEAEAFTRPLRVFAGTESFAVSINVAAVSATVTGGVSVHGEQAVGVGSCRLVLAIVRRL
jgi:hypothetical protein